MLLIVHKYPSYDDHARGELLGLSSYKGRFLRRCFDAASRKASLTVRPTLTSIIAEPGPEDIEKLFIKKKSFKDQGLTATLPTCSTFGHLDPRFEPSVKDFIARCKALKPKCILAMGTLPMWVCTGEAGLKSLRGTVLWSSVLGCKVIPTYDIDMVHADWSLRSAFTFDISKAITESQYPEIRRKPRILTMVERLEEFPILFRGFDLNGTVPLAVDVETEAGQITSIAFALSPTQSVVVPFWDKSRPDWSFWPEHQEASAWAYVEFILAGRCPKIFHNCVYDLSYLMQAHGITVNGPIHDTMLQSHAQQPELLKSLGHLGSLHANESAWKLLNKRRKKDINKSEE